jgi:hypothetical protein
VDYGGKIIQVEFQQFLTKVEKKSCRGIYIHGVWLKPTVLLGYPLAEANGNEFVMDSLPSHLWDG